MVETREEKELFLEKLEAELEADIAALDVDIKRETDRYLFTWDTAGEEAAAPIRKYIDEQEEQRDFLWGKLEELKQIVNFEGSCEEFRKAWKKNWKTV